MVSRSDKQQLTMMLELARLARDNIASFVPVVRFGRLRQSFRFIVTKKQIIIYSVYYWARFANDGRKAVHAPSGKVLVFFEDPRDDPRITEDYPRKEARRIRLSRDEFYTALRAGQLIITRNVGPAAGLHFLEKGIRKTHPQIPEKLRELVVGRIRDKIRRGKNSIRVVL